MSNDAYRPPGTAVADASQPARAPVPSSVWAAVALLIAAVLSGVWEMMREFGPMQSGDLAPITVFGKVLLLAIPWFFFLPLLRGHAWARAVVAVCVALSVCVYALDFHAMRSPVGAGSMFYLQDSTAIVIGTLPHAANVLALLLLFGPASSWFRRSA